MDLNVMLTAFTGTPLDSLLTCFFVYHVCQTRVRRGQSCIESYSCLSWELDFPKPYTFGHTLYTFMVVVSQVPVAQGVRELARDDQVGQVLWLQVRNLLSRGEVRINAEHSEVLSHWECTWMMHGQAPENIWQAPARGDLMLGVMVRQAAWRTGRATVSFGEAQSLLNLPLDV